MDYYNFKNSAEWGFHTNTKVNGVSLKKLFQGIGDIHANHPNYNIYVMNRLEEVKGLSGDKALDFLEKKLIPELLKMIDDAKKSNKTLNAYFADYIRP